MVRIRLTRAGRKNAPAYRITVSDRKAKRDGKFIELIGHYNPTEDPTKIVLKQDRYDYWTSVGAQPSDAIIKLVAGTYKYKKYNPNAKNEVVEEVAAETEAPAEAPAENAESTETEAASE
jgi:small subunit ribosomal protein S16